MNEMDRGMRSVAYTSIRQRPTGGPMAQIEQQKVLNPIVAAWLPRKGVGNQIKGSSVKEENQQSYSHSQILDFVLYPGAVLAPYT